MFVSLYNFLKKIELKNSSVFLFLFCITLFAYGNILFGDFVFDDNIFIENNVQIRNTANIEEIYKSSTTAGSGLTGDNFYRPNQQFIYMILYAFFDLSPFFFHLVPILFHILNAYLIFLLLSQLGISRRASLLGASLFTLHPILTQAVSYISGLSEPLVTSTILGTLLIFLKILEDIPRDKYIKYFVFGAGIFTIGLFSKESQAVAIGLAILILIFKYVRGEVKSLTQPLMYIGKISAIFVLYILLRLHYLNFTGVIGLTGDINIYTESIWVRLSTFIHILPEYFKMLLWPLHLYYEKPYEAYASLMNIQSIIGLFILIFSFVGGIISLVRRNGHFFLGFFWFFTALLPVSGIIPINSMYLEHWLYVPIIGIIFYLGYIFDGLTEERKKRATVVVLIVLVLFAGRIFTRNLEWGNPIKFYTNELKYTQTSARIYNNLAMELADVGKCGEAIPNYLRAIELADIYPQTHHNLARCYEAMGKWEQAVAEYIKALQIQPDFIYSINALNSLEQRGIIERK